MKPNPAVLAMPEIDEEAIRAGLRRTLEMTRGCVVEVIMKDNHTIGGRPENVVQWCRIAQEEAERGRWCGRAAAPRSSRFDVQDRREQPVRGWQPKWSAGGYDLSCH